MKQAHSRDRQRRQNFRVAWPIVAFLFPVLLIVGCGGGSTSVQPPPSGPPAPPPPPAFQARAFPGDFFMRLPTAADDGPIPAAAYDQALKEIFVSDPNFNSVEVYSTVDGYHVGEISIPGPAGLGFSPDFSKLYVGTITPHVYVVDPAALRVTGQILFPASMLALSTDATGATLMPVMPYAMADGSVMLGMGYTSVSASSAAVFVAVEGLVRYEPSGGTFTPANPGPSDLAANPARSLDGKFLFVYGFGNAGYELLLYSSDAQGYLPVSGQVQNVGVFLAANANGSQFASVQEVTAPGTGSFNSQVSFLGPNLQTQSQYTINGTVTCAIFSRDGKYFYLMTDLGYLVSLNTQTGVPVGYESLSLGLNPFPVPFFDADETYHLVGGTTGGAFILNASQMQSSPPTAVANFYGIPSTQANPNVGPVSGGTQVQFIPAAAASGGSADGIASSMEAYFGNAPATLDTVAPSQSGTNGNNFLTATAPAATSPGPVTVALTDANNNAVLLPDSFTYGPHILRAVPNAASQAGGDRVTIFAYGLGFFDLSDIHVTIGGTQVNMYDATLNSYASNTYPEQAVTVTAPKGTPGWADVTLTTSNGTDTMKRGIQYLNQEASVGGGPFSFAVYDSVRSVFYLTGNGNSVAVFNASTQTPAQPLKSTSISTGAVLQQEALTPDSSKLLVVDPTDQSVIVFDLVGGTSSAVSAVLASDPANAQVQPVSITAAANNRAFVSVKPCESYPLREINLTNLTVQPRTDMASACAAYSPYPEYGGASADGSTIIYAGSSGQSSVRSRPAPSTCGATTPPPTHLTDP